MLLRKVALGRSNYLTNLLAFRMISEGQQSLDILTVFRHYSNSAPKSEFSRELESIISYLNEKK